MNAREAERYCWKLVGIGARTLLTFRLELGHSAESQLSARDKKRLLSAMQRVIASIDRKDKSGGEK